MNPNTCECVIRTWHDTIQGEWVAQHGDNPEHQFIMTSLDFTKMSVPEGSTLAREYLKRLRDWCERVHAYEGNGWEGNGR